MELLENYIEYAELFHRIKTKYGENDPFYLRDYQKKFYRFLDQIKGPKRVIVLKPRQAGFTTLCASIYMWKMCTSHHFRGIAIADQYARTMEMRDVYSNFLVSLDDKIRPQVESDNIEKILLDNPRRDELGQKAGLGSAVKYGTARDKNCGRAGSRLFAHMTECAFFLYPDDIDEGIQNSIPLFDNSYIIKESTANGKQGIGAPFYELWLAAEAGESIYKPFFVAWYEVDDYTMPVPVDFRPNQDEKEILKIEPKVTNGNLMWRRLKMSEYRKDMTNTDHALPAKERFKQDFPLTPEEAFRSSGRPVFDPYYIAELQNGLRKCRPSNIAQNIKTENYMLKDRMPEITILSPPQDGRQYFVGADVAEGLEQGDSSAFYVIDDQLNEVATWCGKIDPDMFGHLLIGIGTMYNKALLCIENNNMGHTTVTTVRNAGYHPIYKEVKEDKVKKKKETKYGWRTTELSKTIMINELIRVFRDKDWKPRWIPLLVEMGGLARESNGGVVLNGLDRIVAACLAIMAWKQYKLPVHAIAKKSREYYDTYDSKKSGGMFG